MHDDGASPKLTPQVYPDQTPQPPIPQPVEPAVEQPIDDFISEIPPVSWTASEFIAHQKDTSWYIKLGAIAAVAAVIIFLLTRDLISAGMVVVVAAFMAVLGSRKPRTMTYQLDHQGVHIQQRVYPYRLFKSFSIIDEGTASSISLMPLQRFMPAITMYYAPQDEPQILGTIGSYLPHEERAADTVDRLMHKIRF